MRRAAADKSFASIATAIAQSREAATSTAIATAQATDASRAEAQASALVAIVSHSVRSQRLGLILKFCFPAYQCQRPCRGFHALSFGFGNHSDLPYFHSSEEILVNKHYWYFCFVNTHGVIFHLSRTFQLTFS